MLSAHVVSFAILLAGPHRRADDTGIVAQHGAHHLDAIERRHMAASFNFAARRPQQPFAQVSRAAADDDLLVAEQRDQVGEPQADIRA